MGRFNTTNVIKHLQNNHTNEYDKYVQVLAAKEKCQCLKQTLLEGMKCEKLASDSTKASKVETNALSMLDQPVSVGRNVGCLIENSRNYCYTCVQARY